MQYCLKSTRHASHLTLFVAHAVLFIIILCRRNTWKMEHFVEIQIPPDVPPGSVIGKGWRCIETIIKMLPEPCRIHIKVGTSMK